MRITDWRNIVGALLILLGAFALLQALGYIPTEGSMVAVLFAALFAFGGIAFLSVLFNNRDHWWAAIPGIVLLTLGLMMGLSQFFPGFEPFAGAFFLAGISAAFWVVYAIAPANWWAIIPGGVLLTLAAVAGISDTVVGDDGLVVGGLFFLGMALTFAVLGIMRIEGRRMQWPWIPAIVLFAMSAILFILGPDSNVMNFLWPVALILGGLYMLYVAFFRKK